MKRIEVLNPGNRKLFSLVYGILAGLGYAIGAWGVDAVYLSNAHGIMPLAKLAAGGVICIIVGLLAGILTRMIDRVWSSVIIWTAAGFTFSWLATRMQYTGMYMIFGWLRPELQSLVNYTIDLGVKTRSTLTIIIALVVSVVGGLLFGTFVEDSSNASYPSRRWGPIILWLLAFAGAGLLGDSYINQPMREATVVLDSLIQYQLDHQDEGISDEVMLNLRLRGLRGISDIIHKPRKLLASEYDSMMVAIKVMVDFEGTWARCVIVNGTLGNCNPLE
ncbi:MAG: hypothetical protein MUO76_14405 [Anaerolineaceae bacterium]|nr:hypothetical protein [Anaerolineaceae bacterium]